MSTKKKKKKTNLIAFVVIGIVLLVAAVLLIVRYFASDTSEAYYQPESRHERASVTIVEDSITLGWIMVQGTNIDYPVVYETDAVYQGLSDYTWISSKYVDGENRMAIFGHNILNVSDKPLITDPSHTRFEQLMSFVYEDFAKENLYIQYSHDGGDNLYKIYAVGFEDADEDLGESYDSNEELRSYISRVKKNSIYDYDIDVKPSDKLITLSTCTRFFGKDEKTTFKVDARKVRDGEKITKYDVQKNRNYDILNLE